MILKSARIHGDVHYDALTIEQGAQVDGRFSPNSAKRATPATPAPEAVKRVPADDAQAKLEIAG